MMTHMTHDSGNDSKAISKSPTDTKANTLFVDCSTCTCSIIMWLFGYVHSICLFTNKPNDDKIIGEYLLQLRFLVI